jgi:TPR repeat protein
MFRRSLNDGVKLGLGGEGAECWTVRMMKATGCFAALVLWMSGAAFAEGLDAVLVKAREGDVAAQLRAAEMYAKGDGVAKSAKDAIEWYGKAAELGDADAQLALGKIHLGGGGVPKNSVEAAKWFGLAAAKGRAAAQLQMARMHLAGAGVPKDFVEAYKWAGLAEAQGEKQAKPVLAFLTPKLTAVQTAKAQALLDEALGKKASDDVSKGIPLVAPPLE